MALAFDTQFNTQINPVEDWRSRLSNRVGTDYSNLFRMVDELEFGGLPARVRERNTGAATSWDDAPTGSPPDLLRGVMRHGESAIWDQPSNSWVPSLAKRFVEITGRVPPHIPEDEIVQMTRGRVGRNITALPPFLEYASGIEAKQPGEVVAHEKGHVAEKLLRDNIDFWKDVTFTDPVGQTIRLVDVLAPLAEEEDYSELDDRKWDRVSFHDSWRATSPYEDVRGRALGTPDNKVSIEALRSGMSLEKSQAMAAAIDEAAGLVLAEKARNPAFGTGNAGDTYGRNYGDYFKSIYPGTKEQSTEEAGLLSDKMSNEDWVQFIMGRGAEEERKTEVSKQKVEAKRQAQVAEVKKEKTKPSTVREAKAQGSLYFWDSKGNKKLALTAEDVKKFKASDKYDPEGKGALTQMANIGKKEGIEGLLTTAAPKPKDVEVPKAEKKGYNFRNNWEKYYYAGKPKGEKYMEGFQERLSSKKAIPDKAKEAIEIAVDIFGGDKDKNGKRYSADRLRKDLQNIGRVESQYRKKESTVGGTEKGWWQVKPSTAKDALENAKKHFGKKFNKHFKKHGGYDGLLDRAKKGTLAALMLKDEELAAAFAAVQVIRTFDQE